ncbi:MAG: CaiB/BaiF CoA transferase family protein [Solirubrobacterales bacterium]
MSSSAKPIPALYGLKVVEFAHVIAGPLAGGLMADLGADVIHVEPPGLGDTARKIGPHRDDVYLWWKVSGRNKRSVTIDLRQAEGQALARDLVAAADVAIVSLRADTLAAWGLDWESLHAVNEQLVMLQISGYGAKTAMRNSPGFGKVGEARSGVVNLTGFADQPPVHTGFSHGDATTGLMGAYAVMAALYRREHDEDFAGEWIDLALFESLFRLIEWQVIVYDQLGEVPGRSGNRMAISPAAVVNTYETADGEWITITSATQRSVLSVIRLLGLPAEEYSTVEAQTAAADLLDERMRDWIAARGSDEALAELERAGVVASRIFSARDIVEDEIYNELGDIASVPDRQLGEVRMQGVIPRLANHPGRIWRTGAGLGEDNDEALGRWLGLDAAVIEGLRGKGVIGGASAEVAASDAG